MIREMPHNNMQYFAIIYTIYIHCITKKRTVRP